MTSVRVIILAQGEQTRLPELKTPKQLLALPVCEGVSILRRTLIQLGYLCHDIPGFYDKATVQRPTVIGGDAIRQADLGGVLAPTVVTLPDPGNSSLKGIYRYLTGEYCRKFDRVADLNVVLLGDVVYSWHALRRLMRTRSPTNSDITFCGTSDLSPSGGELWGVAWNDIADDQMMTALDAAVRKHPPFGDYQPGQMRRWLWEFGVDRHAMQTNHATGQFYQAVDDYTRDIDLPEHVSNLVQLSAYAAADDRHNGVVW